MPRGKLILICHFGGKFVTQTDDTLSYSGGEAHAIDVTPETMFDILKLKMAKDCNLDSSSLSVKYFLPGNKRTLITMANDKDLKRMRDFCGNAFTADVFLMGKKGFGRQEKSSANILSKAEPADSAAAVVSTESRVEPVETVTISVASEGGAAMVRPIETVTSAVASEDGAATVQPIEIVTSAVASEDGSARVQPIETVASAVAYEGGASRVKLEENVASTMAFEGQVTRENIGRATRENEVEIETTDVASKGRASRVNLVENAAATVASPPADNTHVVLGLSSTSIGELQATLKRKASASVSKKSPARSTAKKSRAARVTSLNSTTVALDSTKDVPTAFDINASPADTVKKRRRTASWRFGANGHTIASVDDNVALASSKRNHNAAANLGRQMKKMKHADGVGQSKKSSRRNNTQIFDDNVDDIDEENNIDNNMDYQLGINMAYERKTLMAAADMDDQSKAVFNPEDSPSGNMIASWKYGITGVGQSFKDVVEFRNTMQKYAIARRFHYRLWKNDTNRAIGTCTVKDCTWRVYASWVPSEQVFRIKKFNDVHTCGGESWKGANFKRNWLVDFIKERLKESPHHKPKQIAKSISEEFGLNVGYGQVWRGLEDAREQLQGSYKESYDQLPWFCDKIVEANPGSFANITISDDRTFRRLFISFHASIFGLSYCRPLIFLDSTALRSKYHEMVLTATALDADDGLFPVAFAIVDVDNDENWRWFLEQLNTALSTSQSLTFVSDREKGLSKFVHEIFENAHHGYSIYHLMENFKKMLRGPGPIPGDGKGSLYGSLATVAQAARPEEYRAFTEQIKRISLDGYNWLVQIEPEYWTSALFKGEPYAHVSVNIAQLYANWIEEAKELPIIQKIETFRCKILELMRERQIASEDWTTKLTPSKEKSLEEATVKAYFTKVLISSETLFEVHDESINVVNMEKKYCSCLKWKETGLPCSHAIAVFNRSKRTVYDYCPQQFTVECYRETYTMSIEPILAIYNPSDRVAAEEYDVVPPATPRPPGRPKENQTRFRERTVTCSRCGRDGHNKATCKDHSALENFSS